MAEQGSHDVITVVLTADNHLGYSVFGEHARKREERLRRLRRAFQQATDFAVGQGVDLFIQAGDLFDTPNPAEQDRSFVAARLAELRQAGIRTFAVSGIHDTPTTDIGSYTTNEGYMAPQVSYAHLGALHYFPPLFTPQHSSSVEKDLIPTGNELRSSFAQPVGKVVLEPVMVDVRGVLLALCGLSVIADQEGDLFAKVHVQSEIERAAISLLILHAPIEGLTSQENIMHDSTFPIGRNPVRAMPPMAPVVARSTIAGASESFHTILAGYHHAYQHVRIAHTDVIVAGATQHIDFNDPDNDPGFVFLGLAADGIRWCHHIPVDALHLQRLVIHTAELWNDSGKSGGLPTDSSAGTTDVGARLIAPPTDMILERLRPLCTADSMVQLQLVGELSRYQYHQLDLGKVRHYGEEHCFELALDESGLSLLPVAASLESSAPSLNGHSGGTADGADKSAVGGIGTINRPLRSDKAEERLSPREELVNLADEWIAAVDDEQEKKALIATKEELLTALDRMKRRSS